MHMWDAGRGRDASPVHSLAVVLRGRKHCTGRRYQTLLQCAQSCRAVVYHSECYCFDRNEWASHMHTNTHTHTQTHTHIDFLLASEPTADRWVSAQTMSLWFDFSRIYTQICLHLQFAPLLQHNKLLMMEGLC